MRLLVTAERDVVGEKKKREKIKSHLPLRTVGVTDSLSGKKAPIKRKKKNNPQPINFNRPLPT